jgi:FtsP/CotA-like multicopper oxidase with cupredoxin domain
MGKVTIAERKAAAANLKALGMKLGATASDRPGNMVLDPGGVPHYFGPYGNWAYSPLPKGPIAVITVAEGGSGYTNPVITIEDVYGTGSGATPASATLDLNTGAITAITGGLGGTNYSAPIVTITDPTGTGAAASATIGGTLTGGMRKFLDSLPGLGPQGKNNLNQYIPVAAPNTTAYPGSDYYEIALVEFRERMHRNLPPVVGGKTNPAATGGTKLRGYVQEVNGVAVGLPQYLGPLIIADRDRPVRVKFTNRLPIGAGGDLFLPVDTSVMGAGLGMNGGTEMTTQNRATVHNHGHDGIWISDGTTHQWITPAGETTSYPKGVSARNVPDMWFTEAGVRVDAGTPGATNDPPGVLTFYYTNQQSARLMFYHDHAEGITRLNVYAGEAGGYVITDQVEKDMINGTNLSGVNPGSLKVLPGLGIPLVIQDKSFVDATTIAAQDPTWNSGTGPRVAGKITAAVTGDLWYPHIYMSAQNPWDLSGMNAFGRWHYGPWFWPPTADITYGPVANPYYDPANAPWEPPMMPGVPNPSMAGEAFMDTPIVNGTAYPYLEVEPKAYRFRILNAADDRFFNLQLYVAANRLYPTTPGTTGTVLSNGSSTQNPINFTEVKMVPVNGAPNQYADTPSGLPDPATKGPDWIQIGTEGGFLPAPAVIPSQPIGWNLNATTFNFGTVNQHSLLLGCAERADVIVDFSAYAGKTLILYNDAPAAFPAGIPTYDYYTGCPDQMDTGGAPTTLPGYGPNTRTIMQIRVTKPLTTPTTDVTLANLNAVFAKGAAKRGVFEVSQPPIIIPQAAYNSAYNVTNFPTDAFTQYINLFDKSKTFRPIDSNGVLQAPHTFQFELKAAHDEMGGVYDTQYGRMAGMLGLDDPTPTSTAANFIPFPFLGPPVDVVKGSISGTQIGGLADGTQIWRITHNGVDSHPVHTHLFNTQLINRISMDGGILPPDANELGWKDTFRMNPLEIITVALRPALPDLSNAPFVVPNSIRLINPNMPEGALLDPPPPAGEWFDPAGNPLANGMPNHYVNFGWEYMWHCHILAHEEMDMMHAFAFAVPPVSTPALQPLSVIGSGASTSVVLTWTDVVNATNFTVQRANDAGFTTGLQNFPLGKALTYNDPIGDSNQAFYYRVFAINVVGDTYVYPGSAGFPTESLNSDFSNVVPYTPPSAPPAAPTNLTGTVQGGPGILLTWTDNADNETGFIIERRIGTGAYAAIASVGPKAGTGSVTYTDTPVLFATTYGYRVAAQNAAGISLYATSAAIPSPALGAPTLTATAAIQSATSASVTLTWNNILNETGYRIQYATNATFTNPVTITVAANTTTRTVSNLLRNQKYYFRLRAENNVGVSLWRTINITTP